MVAWDTFPGLQWSGSAHGTGDSQPSERLACSRHTGCPCLTCGGDVSDVCVRSSSLSLQGCGVVLVLRGSGQRAGGIGSVSSDGSARGWAGLEAFNAASSRGLSCKLPRSLSFSCSRPFSRR